MIRINILWEKFTVWASLESKVMTETGVQQCQLTAQCQREKFNGGKKRPQITLAVEMLSRRLGRLDTYLLAVSVITAWSVLALVAFGKRKHLLWSC